MSDSKQPFPVEQIPECIHRMLKTLHPDWDKNNPNLLTIETILASHGLELDPGNLPRLQQILADRLTVAHLASETATGVVSQIYPVRTEEPPLAIAAKTFGLDLPTACRYWIERNEEASADELADQAGVSRATIYSKGPKWAKVRQALVGRNSYRATNAPKRGHRGNKEGEYSDGPGHDLDSDE